MSSILNILIVDDDRLFRFNIRALLEDLGYDIITEAENGREALEICERERPDLVLTDLRMPEMDGLSLILNMQGICPEIPVIVISGAGTLSDAVEAVRNGAWDYLTKPVRDTNEIDIVIRRTLERARLRAENLRYREHLEELVKEQTRKLETEVAEKERLIALLHEIGEEVSIKTGEDYFNSLVRFISRQLNVDYAFIGLLQSNQRKVKTIAVCCRNAIIDNFEYYLKGAPCDGVVGKTACFYSKNIRKKFPDHKILSDIEAESYAGIPLFGSGGIPVGLIAVVSCSPLKENGKDTVISLLQIFGGRCSAELQRLQSEEERKLLENQLRQAQKMEAVGQLAGGVAHDFNNLLFVITGYTEIIMDKLPPESDLKNKAEQIMKAAQRAAKLVSQLLLFSRRQTMQAKQIDLNDLISNLMKMLTRVIGEHIALEINPGYNLKTVCGDPGQLEQILMNLCVNAKDAMNDTGRISIETRNILIDEEFCETYPWAKPGQYVLLSVSDNGTGIPYEIQERIFEPFFTTKEVGKGTGLGLAAVYGIVKSHQGLIHLYSDPGQGAVFKIYLPAMENSRAGADKEQQDAAAVSGGSETVLIAEDEELLRNLITGILKRAGYRVLSAHDGEEAIRLFNNHMQEINIALLDIVMPKISGRKVFEQIKFRRPYIPVIFMTGYSKGVLPIDFFPNTHYEMLQKPISRTDLLNKIRTALDSSSYQ
jgi:signal transduction histidine kinase/DNA-binding response OmpR family regulator